MNRKHYIFLICIIALLAGPVISSFAASEFYIKIEGTKQGVFKGQSLRDAWKTWIPGLSYSHSVKTVTSLATGLPSGKRQYTPVRALVEWGPATPQIISALVTGEVLKTVTMEFLETTPEGIEQVACQIKLTNALVTAVNMDVPEAAGSQVKTAWVSFSFQRIEWTCMNGNVMFTDDNVIR
jgi:type VI secretion system secreted protein Hcp